MVKELCGGVIRECESVKMINTICVNKKDGSEAYYDRVINTYVKNGALFVIEFAPSDDVGSKRIMTSIQVPLCDIKEIPIFENRLRESETAE